MSTQFPKETISRRQLLTLIGALGGGAALYEMMGALGHASESPYRGPLQLTGDPKGARVVVLGAGLAGLTAAMELRQAGYKVEVLEYNNRPGGRCWTLRGGDQFTELGGERQVCTFDKGLYINPGPWRVSHKHRAFLDYCRRLKVPVEPFIEVNYNAYLHASTLFGGKPQRMGHVVPDMHGHIAELLAKATNEERLDDWVSREDGEVLREVLRSWAGLDRQFRYTAGPASSQVRGYASSDFDAGTRLPSTPLPMREVLDLCLASDAWAISNHSGHSHLQNTMFQPVGGVDMIARAMAAQVSDAIRYNAKVIAVQQDDRGVRVVYETAGDPGRMHEATADWCISTIPLTILGQIDMQVGEPMKRAIDAVPYGPAVKVGLQFKRRFWEEDDAIYGGLSHTDLPIRTLAYPSHGTNTDGPGVMYGAFMFGTYAYEFSGMSPDERIRKAVAYGRQIHPQYEREFQNGVSVAWHRMPFSLGCHARWSQDLLKTHYRNLRAIDGRIALAGEALSSAAGGAMEGSIVSALDQVERLHKRVMAR